MYIYHEPLLKHTKNRPPQVNTSCPALLKMLAVGGGGAALLYFLLYTATVHGPSLYKPSSSEEFEIQEAERIRATYNLKKHQAEVEAYEQELSDMRNEFADEKKRCFEVAQHMPNNPNDPTFKYGQSLTLNGKMKTGLDRCISMFVVVQADHTNGFRFVCSKTNEDVTPVSIGIRIPELKVAYSMEMDVHGLEYNLVIPTIPKAKLTFFKMYVLVDPSMLPQFRCAFEEPKFGIKPFHQLDPMRTVENSCLEYVIASRIVFYPSGYTSTGVVDKASVVLPCQQSPINLGHKVTERTLSCKKIGEGRANPAEMFAMAYKEFGRGQHANLALRTLAQTPNVTPRNVLHRGRYYDSALHFGTEIKPTLSQKDNTVMTFDLTTIPPDYKMLLMMDHAYYCSLHTEYTK